MRRSQRPVWLGEDGRGWDHVRVHVQVIRDERLGAIEIAIYCGIAAHAETQSGEAHPSAETLGRYADVHERTARDAIGVLVEAGYVEVERRPGKASILRLLPPPVIPTPGPGSEVEAATPGPRSGHPGSRLRGTPGPGSDELEPGNESQELPVPRAVSARRASEVKRARSTRK